MSDHYYTAEDETEHIARLRESIAALEAERAGECERKSALDQLFEEFRQVFGPGGLSE